MHPFIPAGLALALAAPLLAAAQTPVDIDTLRREIDAIRAAYEQRLSALEQRLKAAEAAAAAPAARADAAAPTGAPATVPAAPPAATAARGNAFNPEISLILSGGYSRATQDPASYGLTGFALPAGAEAGPGARGFSLAESELSLAASIDPWLRGAAHIALHPDNEVSVEEAYVQTTSLGAGFTLKAGRYLSGVGYLNEKHRHSWDFADAPLAYQAFLGTQFADDGVQLRWLAPTDTFLELGAEVGRGRAFPGADNDRNGAGATALFAHTGGDVGDSHSWRAGISLLKARPREQALVAALDSSAVNLFSGRSRVVIGDFVWKWAPRGNATRTHFALQGEVLRGTRDGEVSDASGALTPVRTTQSGWYLQGVYQFMPRWRAGLRTERLDSGATSALTDVAYRPRKESLMLDFSPSEFSRVRLQLARDRSRLGEPDRQLVLQYQMSLGAHGGHGF
ncbi:MAG TPA: hypothetical protein VLJ58_04205 [Ramlibacter sp.]|nr:hypothetical protein [Ramlibacter sp.]